MSNNIMPEIVLSWMDGTNDTKLKEIKPTELPLKIGRDSINGIWLHSKQVTRKHAQISAENGRYWIEDLGSTNGVLIDNERIAEKTVLEDGTIFQIQPFVFSVVINTKEASDVASDANSDADTEVITNIYSAIDSDAETEAYNREPLPDGDELDEDVTVPHPDRAGVDISLAWSISESDEIQQGDFRTPITIGRDESCTIQLSNKSVSREHARIETLDGVLAIVDQESINGLSVNGHKQSTAYLHTDDEIKIGLYTLRVLYLDSTQEAPSTDDKPGISQASTARDRSATTVRVTQGSSSEQRQRSSNPALLDAVTEPFIPFEPEEQDGSQSSSDFPPDIFQAQDVSISELRRSGFPIEEKVYLAIGGGLGSFVWADHLRIYGADSRDIRAIGFDGPNPYGRYRRLCKNSQIPSRERLRSNSDSCPDNIWGWPGYAVREAWHEFGRGNLKKSAALIWQIFNEPRVDTYTPISGNVFRSIDREAERIGWRDIWRSGRVKSIRKTTDGRYAIAYTETQSRPGHTDIHHLIIAQYVHISVGYPAIRLLPDLYDYRKRTSDFKRVVNAYEPHDHIYRQLEDQGGVVLLRGRGIVASRILQRLSEARKQNPNVCILHLMRSQLKEGYRYGQAQREIENHWEFQPFNWPKSCWGGDLRRELEQATPTERKELLNDWGGTTTADRTDWRNIVQEGIQDGWYQQSFGAVKQVDHDRERNRLITSIRGTSRIRSDMYLEADFIIDATGLESEIESHPLLNDLLERYRLKRNPQQRFQVRNDFEMLGMRNQEGRMYAAGVITLGGPHAAVDSFLGLQYAALRSVDSLARAGAPGLRYLDGLRSVRQWLRWARGVQP